ncbi:hypothetical protein RHMOL_RhmolUnG0001000 [Rhododendron molle]|nr:hypothetical protein RHMOL_RhmolUnG0001000 [Rhododendron molle]
MAEAILGIIAQKAGELAVSQIIKESSRLSRVREDLVWIETEMRFIQSSLKDAEAEQLTRKEVQSTFIREIWDLAYDVEDIIDTYFPNVNLDVFHPVEISLPNLQTLHGLPGGLFKTDWLHELTGLRTLQVNWVNKDIIGVLSDAAPVSHKLEELSLDGPLLETTSLNLVRYDNLFELYISYVKLNYLSHDKLPPNLIKLNL